ncbi:MAG: hypothetical protein JXR25_06715 [Pontiellaceae bacterium]|nr:hypothetical protein [Pontiellaceae bacterium]MBN2784502.1 hypothetical protein [Pontiellaceae bacterium]
MNFRFSFFILGLTAAVVSAEQSIDRQSLVQRHNVHINSIDGYTPLSVGNGGFAFTVDATGLQTFPEPYRKNGIPIETLSRWAWVSEDNPEGYKLSDANEDFIHPDGSVLGYPTRSSTPAGQWMRRNPRPHPLGQIALDWNRPLTIADIKDIDQTLDLWHGVINSHYKLNGTPVDVKTACMPGEDTVLIRIESDLIASGALGIRLAFPRGHDITVKNTPGFDWTHPELHLSKRIGQKQILRFVNGLEYYVSLNLPAETTDTPHTFTIHANPGERVLELAVNFAPDPQIICADFDLPESHWSEFWKKSAAADFAGSSNPLADKLENRIILSQYLTAIQMAGDVPPQESGLTCNTWYGKHHTEMIWWHAAHFPLWGHPELLERNLNWYVSRLPEARTLAASRNLNGARWAKMVGPDMRESPGGNPLIAWNQPHPIYLSELLYRSSPTEATIEQYGDLVQATAECLASMLWLAPERNEYVLGPPLWIVQEIHDRAASQNPAFELAYWRWTLQLAQQWRERRGLERETLWDDIIRRIAPIPQKDGKYVALESIPDTWDNIDSRHDHPGMLMALGMIPLTASVDLPTMNRTLDAVLAYWDWETKIWGWDYPMIAMTATRLGRPDDAIDVLLRDGPNNRYLANGHCPVRPLNDPEKSCYDVAVYLPANGSFLSAVSLMLGGWDECETEFPGFPKDGTWQIKAEGWTPLP